MREISISGTTLVVVPHSDDEILLFGGLIQRLTKQGNPVYVALVTNGDYEADTEEAGSIRPMETIKGLQMLGLPEKQVILMGYADTGMPREESFLAGLYDEQDGEKIHPSHVGTHTYGIKGHPDFHTERYGSPAPYTRNAFCRDLRELIQEIKPQNIFTTHPLDAHGDHSALYHFVKDSVKGANLYAGFAHSPAGDIPLPDECPELPCPAGMEREWETALCLNLTPDEVEAKRRALEVHVTALKPDAVDFLRSFVKNNEVYYPMEVIE